MPILALLPAIAPNRLQPEARSRALPYRMISLRALLLSIAPRPDASAHAAPAAAQPKRQTAAWTTVWDVAVREAPSDVAPVLTRLDIDQELRVTGAIAGIGGVRWAALDGYARAVTLSAAPVVPTSAPASLPVVPHPAGAHAPILLRTKGTADGPLRLRAGLDVAAPLLRIVANATPLPSSPGQRPLPGRHGTASPRRIPAGAARIVSPSSALPGSRTWRRCAASACGSCRRC